MTGKTKLDEVCDAVAETVRVACTVGETDEDLFMRLALSMEAVVEDDRLFYRLRQNPAFVKLWKAIDRGLEAADNTMAGDDQD